MRDSDIYLDTNQADAITGAMLYKLDNYFSRMSHALRCKVISKFIKKHKVYNWREFK